MPLLGKAFLAIWNDYGAANEDEYNDWHTYEHVPERVSIPGFLRGRRYVDWSASHHRYFNLYEGAELGVFNGPDYLARLNAPTPWTQKIMPGFTNFVRGACRTAASEGVGVGGAALTLRFTPPPNTEPNAFGASLVEKTRRIHGVTAAHFGMAETGVTTVKTNERAYRKDKDEVFAALLVAEGVGRGELASARDALRRLFAEDHPQAGDLVFNLYELALMLTHAELTGGAD